MVLWINGSVTVLAIVAVFMPLDWMYWTHSYLKLGAVPSGPIFEYLARTVSALYAVHGGLCFVLARDVRRYGPVITYIAVVAIAFSGVVLWIDYKAHLPRMWVAIEAPAVVLVGGVTLALRLLARRSYAMRGHSHFPRSGRV